jgi:hypothetical protein
MSEPKIFLVRGKSSFSRSRTASTGNKQFVFMETRKNPERLFCGQIFLQALQALLGSLGQVFRWYSADVEPADLLALVGFFDARFAVLISAEIGGGDPVLFFLGQNMVNYIEQLHYIDDETVFFPDLSDQGVLEGLAKLNASAGKLPLMFFIPCF